jgi:hypothetical protein
MDATMMVTTVVASATMKLFSSGSRNPKLGLVNTSLYAAPDRCAGMIPFAPPTPAAIWPSDSSEVRRIQKNGNSAMSTTMTTAR